MDKVSIIVPVYNGEKNLNACVVSLLKQSHENIEILLINDGSKDDSLVLCRRWEEKDPRVKVYTHENRGVSFTRNRGLELFTGDWVTFVDCDDTVDRDYVKVILETAKEHGALLCQCAFRELGKNAPPAPAGEGALLGKEEVLEIFGKHFSGAVWGKLYHKSVINSPDPLRFDEDIRIGEDMLFWCRAVMKTGAVYKTSFPGYLYCPNESGAMGARSFHASYTDYLARLRCLALMEDFPRLSRTHLADLVRVAADTLLFSDEESPKEKIKELKTFIRKNRKVLLQNQNVIPKEKMKALFVNFSLFRCLWRRSRGR